LDRSKLQNYYESLARAKDGSAAVGGARSMSSLKQAQSSADAITAGREEALKGFAYNNPAPPAVAAPEPARPYGSGYVGGAGSMTTPAQRSNGKPLALMEVKKESDRYAQQSRFVGGRTFYLNNDQWVDSEIQKHPKAKRVRVQFASPEYFELMKKNPGALTWLSVGRNMHFLLGETIYEIYE
jgi:hypothetical protein